MEVGTEGCKGQRKRRIASPGEVSEDSQWVRHQEAERGASDQTARARQNRRAIPSTSLQSPWNKELGRGAIRSLLSKKAQTRSGRKGQVFSSFTTNSQPQPHTCFWATQNIMSVPHKIKDLNGRTQTTKLRNTQVQIFVTLNLVNSFLSRME